MEVIRQCWYINGYDCFLLNIYIKELKNLTKIIKKLRNFLRNHPVSKEGDTNTLSFLLQSLGHVEKKAISQKKFSFWKCYQFFCFGTKKNAEISTGAVVIDILFLTTCITFFLIFFLFKVWLRDLRIAATTRMMYCNIVVYCWRNNTYQDRLVIQGKH